MVIFGPLLTGWCRRRKGCLPCTKFYHNAHVDLAVLLQVLSRLGSMSALSKACDDPSNSHQSVLIRAVVGVTKVSEVPPAGTMNVQRVTAIRPVVVVAVESEGEVSPL